MLKLISIDAMRMMIERSNVQCLWLLKPFFERCCSSRVLVDSIVSSFTASEVKAEQNFAESNYRIMCEGTERNPISYVKTRNVQRNFPSEMLFNIDHVFGNCHSIAEKVVFPAFYSEYSERREYSHPHDRGS